MRAPRSVGLAPRRRTWSWLGVAAVVLSGLLMAALLGAIVGALWGAGP